MSLGKLVSDGEFGYGGVKQCANVDCQKTLCEEDGGAYLFSDVETGKLVVFCDACSTMVQLNHGLRFRLVAL